MKAKIKPSICQGTVKIPPSKSMAHRAIICAALADGKSIISNIDYSVDIQTTIDCMKKLGAHIECFDDYVIIHGIKDFDSIVDTNIECNESGSTLRFLIPIFSLTNNKITFPGKNRLLKRPQKIYEDLFNESNLYFKQDENKIEILGSIQPKEYILNGNISSQFISGLLFTLPLLNNDSKIKIIPPFESKSYIDLTIQMLSKFGINISWENNLTLTIPGNQKYIAHNETVEGDYSQYAFFGVLDRINSNISILGMDDTSLQGDKQILDILDDYKVEKEHHEIDLNNCPDLGPILCILGMFSNGTTRIYNAARLRIKESDRIEAMVSECAKMGCIIETTDDEMIIHGNSYHAPNVELYGWKDHRIVMACAIALTKLGGIIDGCEAISKSYPSFFEDLKNIGIEVEIYD